MALLLLRMGLGVDSLLPQRAATTSPSMERQAPKIPAPRIPDDVVDCYTQCAATAV
jgi:hypothetical protein